jgi:hypothetical protein
VANDRSLLQLSAQTVMHLFGYATFVPMELDEQLIDQVDRSISDHLLEDRVLSTLDVQLEAKMILVADASSQKVAQVDAVRADCRALVIR